MRAAALALRSKLIYNLDRLVYNTTAVQLALEGSDGDVACQHDLRFFFTCEHVQSSLDPQISTYSSENSRSTGMQHAFCC